MLCGGVRGGVLINPTPSQVRVLSGVGEIERGGVGQGVERESVSEREVVKDSGGV